MKNERFYWTIFQWKNSEKINEKDGKWTTIFKNERDQFILNNWKKMNEIGYNEIYLNRTDVHSSSVQPLLCKSSNRREGIKLLWVYPIDSKMGGWDCWEKVA